MLGSIPLNVLLLIGVFAVATGVTAAALAAERQRRLFLRRASGALDVGSAPHAVRERSVWQKIADWLAARTPARVGADTTVTSRLVQAGFDGHAAPAVYGLLRVVALVVAPAIALAIAPRDDVVLFTACIVIAVIIGLLLPPAVLNRAVRRRQNVLRAGVPDALDLLVVCIEAGVAMDAAIQRVARELDLVHPVLAAELLAMSRRMGAGIPREQAMQSLYLRTGLDELHSLTTHLVQSERWGTSIATVLRQYARDLRRRRRQAAEKRAATVGTRMLFPLALFIFPTIFVVILGPAVIQIMSAFNLMKP
jgi:tight adherence protein C